MTDIQIKSTDICKQIFLQVVPEYVKSARKNIATGDNDYKSAMDNAGLAAVKTAITIARQWLEY